MEPTAISTRHLTKHYGTTVALDDLSLEIPQGEIFGLLGPNGAGKTTVIRLLLGLARPTSGTASVFGIDVTRDASAAHRHIAYVPGDVNLWPTLTGHDCLELLGRLAGQCDETYRTELVERFRLDPSRKVRTLSKGNRQKIALIAALASRADLLILDEPTSGLDPLMEREFRATVAQASARGQGVLLSSHILSEVDAVCQRVALLRDGRLIEVGSLNEMRALSSVRIDLRFDTAPASLGDVAGLQILEQGTHHVSAEFRGDMATLLAALQGSSVTSFLSREASLEEMFLSHYGDPSTT